MRTKWTLAVLAAALLLAACGGGGSEDSANDGSGDSQMNHDMGSMDGGDEAIDFGRPGQPADADREIEIEALDTLAFQPASIEVGEGETVTFVVTNAGQNRHEFTLGDEDYQIAHQEEMEMDGMAGHESNSVILEPGERKELSWTFTETGEVLYACHEPGHYEGGMVGTVAVD